MARAVRKARHVLTGSEATRRDLETFFPSSRGKVTSVGYGVSAVFAPARYDDVARFRQLEGLPAVYVLTVGNRKDHKNLETAAEVVSRAHTAHPELGWVVVGKRFHQPDGVDSVRPLLRNQLIELEDVPDQDLRMIYAGARALLMPSIWEGFGLPALEAMACGTPVIASNIPAIQEVVGAGGLLRAPTDVQGLTDALLMVLNDAEQREELSAKALSRSEQFTWDRTVARTWEIMEEALQR
jgi:glycosyltransferase involved in cell wall biosynthesis